MAKPTLLRSPSLESGTSVTETTSLRHSLFDTKDDFIERIAPVGVAAIYFGSFSLSPQDAPLSRQALFKLSFLYRHFLQPGGIRIVVNRQTAVLSGAVTSPYLATMAEILALQIEGILHVKNETQPKADPSLPPPTGQRKTEDPSLPPTTAQRENETIREAVQFLFATDQTLRSGVQASSCDGNLLLHGEVSTAAQKTWAEQVAEAAGATVQSTLAVNPSTPYATLTSAEPPPIDDESLEALILFRLRLVRETEHLPVRVKATRGIVTLQGKVRTEALRQRAENIARSTLGLRELRSTLVIGA